MTNSNPETGTDNPATSSEPTGKGKRPCRGRRGLWRIPVFMLLFIFVKSAIFMVLWNHLIPDLFHGPLLNYGQAIGLLILAKIVVGFGGRHGGPGGHWRRHMASLSEEDRQKLRSEIRGRWGHRH